MERKTFITALVILASFFITAFLSLVLLNPVLWLAVYDKTELTPGSLAYSQWIEPKITILFQAYFFNLTNPNEFRAGQKPIVQQVGPYTYKEHREKIDVVGGLLSKTLQYREFKSYHFIRELSVGPETDIIQTVNLGYLAIDTKFGWLPSVITKVVEFLENRTSEHLFVNLTVNQLMWGYEDPFLKLLKSVYIPVPTTMIGLYLNKNNSDDGVIKIYSSNKDPENFGHVVEYHGASTLPYWKSDQANQINGSDGSLFHPYMKWSEQPYVFSADICRSIQLNPTEVVKLDGVPVYKYLPFEDTFRSPLTTEKNRGFCIDWPNCMKDNMFDVSTCYPGSPITMSLPHFLYADESYKQSVVGQHPTEELNTTFNIEPQTGVVFKAEKKLQINAIVHNNPKFKELSQIKDVYLPVMFMNESFTLDQETVRGIRDSLVTGPKVAKVILSLLTVVSLLLCLALIVYYLIRKRHMTDGNAGQYNPVPEPEVV